MNDSTADAATEATEIPSGKSRMSTLIEVKNLKMYFPVTDGALISRAWSLM